MSCAALSVHHPTLVWAVWLSLPLKLETPIGGGVSISVAAIVVSTGIFAAIVTIASSSVTGSITCALSFL